MNKYYLLVIFILFGLSVFGQSVNADLFDGVSFKVKDIKTINTVASDISPFFIGDNLYFSSVRREYFNKESRERKNKAFYDIYRADLDKDGYLAGGRSLEAGFGANYHEGPACYCESTGELFVTYSNVIAPAHKRRMIPIEDIRLRLVIMKNKGNGWELTEEFPYNDKNFNLAHPAVSLTGDTLIFSSDMDNPEAQGNSDLYISIRKSGKWSTPKNLGSKINTGGNEMYPVFIDGGLLSFSSDGRSDCAGGLDIYYTSFPKEGDIISFGSDINTHLDDFGLVIHKNKEIGYFASNRGNVGSDDIYMVNIINVYYTLHGVVKDDFTDELLPDANVLLTDCEGKEIATKKSDSDGTFNFKIKKGSCVNVEASKPMYGNTKENATSRNSVELRLKLTERELLVLDADTENPIENALLSCGDHYSDVSNSSGIIHLENYPKCKFLIEKDGYANYSFELGIPHGVVNGIARDTVLMYKLELNKNFVLKNIYYDFDKWDILPGSEIELNKLISIMEENPTIKVELGSHTDCRGKDEYNKWLSQKRSDSAVNYIVSHGISKDRIVARGYGETQLVNRCYNGVSCKAWEHRQNRRTEFKIIGL